MRLELETIVSKLIANEKFVGLAKMMQPADVLAVITVDLGLKNSDAQSVVNNLLAHPEEEGMSYPGIETNKQYPVPASIRRDNEDLDEDFVNNMGGVAPEMDPDKFPPAPRPEPAGWPYDSMTVAAMDPANKGKKRGMMDVKQKEQLPQGNPFNANLKKRLQPGADYGGSQGIYSRNSSHFDNSNSSSGRSYDGKGRPGWSASPPGKEFDMPIDEDDMPKNTPIDLNVDDVFGPSPVGSSIPQFQGGHSQQRKMGFRKR